jgi:hypothetical protein
MRRRLAVAPAAAESGSEIRRLFVVLARIELAVDELRAHVAPELAQRRALFEALAAAFGSGEFTSVELLEVAAERPEGALAREIERLTGAPVGGLRRLARRLAKLVDKSAGGCTLLRVGDSRGGALYAIQTADWAA